MNKREKRFLSTIIAGVMTLSIGQSAFAANIMKNNTETLNESDLRLWYTKSSSEAGKGLNENQIWEEYTLPIGNGNLGGNVYGDIESEHITFNEKTLWTGGPSSKRPNYNGGNKETGSNGMAMSDILKEIQEAFALHTTEGDKIASDLCNQLVGISDGYGAYQSWGDIYFDFKGITASKTKDYIRDLDLKTAISSVNFTEKDTEYSREFFVSNPDNVMVIKLEANGKEKLNFDVRFPSKQGATPVVAIDTITQQGEIADNQLKFNSQLKVVAPSGEITPNGDKLAISDAESAYIYISAATDYENDYPVYRTGETAENLNTRVSEVVNEAVEKGYEKVKEDHLNDYKNIFDRVNLDIEQSAPNIPTDELLTEYNKKDTTIPESYKRSLEAMLFQYGRYLTIASSREDSQLPSNLQGLWNNRNDPPWSSDYHMNVNLQMNYWPTYSTNMAESAKPLVDYINSLREPGRETARIYSGVESAKDPVTGEYTEANGFMAHTQNTPFGWTTPGWSFDWGWSPAAVPWILQNTWEMYEYTGDVEYMRTELYPMMKEEVNLYENMLIWDETQQRMVSSPTYSPEHGPRTVGNTYEQTLIWQLYEDTIKATEILGSEDEATIAKWKDTQSKLDPIQVGDDGQIKEWYEETTIGSIPSEGYGHRHLSHLLGLFPGDSISVETPELLDAALVSLKNRTDASTGWGMGQRINTWARAGEGNKAYDLIKNQLKRVGTGISGGGGTYSNLLCAHPPFQIDGNFGATSGVAEMLLQSNMGYINFLPALTDTWANGSVEGVVARGNFEVGIDWTAGKANEMTIKSKNGGEAISKYTNISLATVTDSKGQNIEFKVIDNDKISFDTVKGETYIINKIPHDGESADEPTGLEAERIEKNAVELKWNAVEGENVNYNLYRQIGKGDVVAIAKNIETTEYSDIEAEDILGTFKYSVSAVVNGNESKISESVDVKDLRNMAGFIDDRDSRITYSGSWGDWSEAPNYAGTIKFIESPNGTETATLTFVGTGIEVITCTNADRGKFEVSIDEVVQGEVDTYSQTTKRQQVIYSKEDLEYGKHTIKVRATNTKSSSSSRTKVELDAFKVIDSTIQKTTSISVASLSGITVVGVPNSKLQMKAIVTPDEATNKEVTWSVNDENIGTIDANGLLTTKENNGTVRVTATSKDDTSISGYVDIKVSISTINVEEIIVEDGKIDGTKNPDIKWGGNWSVWAGEQSRHHGGTKIESVAGSTITYDFVGTGIEVYAQKHQNFASFDILIDGVSKGNFSLAGSSTGDDQQKIAEFKELENTNHTIVMTGVERASKREINLDYFKVLKPVTSNFVDKSMLQVEIEEQSKKVEDNYTAESWINFKSAYNKALEVINNENSTVDEVAVAVSELKVSALELVGQESPNPIIPSGAKVEAIGVESKTLMLKWPTIDKVKNYEIYIVNEEGDVKVSETTNNFYRVSELNPGTSYKFVVRVIGDSGKTSDFEVCTVETAGGLDIERPSDVTTITLGDISSTTANITWSEASDNIGVIGYRVYLNGVLQVETNDLSYEFTNLNEGEEYTAKVVALDGAGNTSLTPAIIKFTPKSNGVNLDQEAADVVIEKISNLPDRITLEQKEIVEEVRAAYGKLTEAQKALVSNIDKLIEAEKSIGIVSSKVENLEASEITKDSVKLVWNSGKSVVGLVEYVIYKDGKEIATVPANINEFTISDLKVNTIYGFKVTAKYSNESESKPKSINVRTKK